MVKPVEIKKPSPTNLKIHWNDGFESTITLQNFRNECPCAECKGEQLGAKKIMPKLINIYTPGMNELKSLTPVGNYAVEAVWGDGHDTGIYSYGYLREIFEKYKINE